MPYNVDEIDFMLTETELSSSEREMFTDVEFKKTSYNCFGRYATYKSVARIPVLLSCLCYFCKPTNRFF